jgi:hypothetical protein
MRCTRMKLALGLNSKGRTPVGRFPYIQQRLAQRHQQVTHTRDFAPSPDDHSLSDFVVLYTLTMMGTTMYLR